MHIKKCKYMMFQTCKRTCEYIPVRKRNNKINGPEFCLGPYWEGAGFCGGFIPKKINCSSAAAKIIKIMIHEIETYLRN